VVVLAQGEGRFRPVPVRVGVEADGQSQILEGLEGDEIVVTSAQFLIDSEARLASAVSAMIGGHDHGTDEAMQ
jgi:transposase-like protein